MPRRANQPWDSFAILPCTPWTSDIITAFRSRRNEEFSMKFRAIVLWFAVLVPLLWGVMKTLQNALKLFA
jgi:hypothetical protein